MTKPVTTTISSDDYAVLIGALQQISWGRFVGAEEAVTEGRWHEYSSRLQDIAHHALKTVRIL